ncbi:MAG: response regulator transcription factor [Rhodoferax sp.]|nr:response regulator transcription factor [Rhodoferax sp.]
MWRVLVVEDDPEMREFFSGSVSRCAELQLVASVGTVAEASAWLDGHATEVDVLLTDLGLPDGSGLEVIRHATRLNPACEALVISMFGDEDNVLASIEAGALGYIHKDSTPDDIAQTILDMRAGASPISPMIARRVLSKYRSDRRQHDRGQAIMGQAPIAIKNEAVENFDAVAQRGVLSPREQEVLALIARGFSYAEIARLQGLSVHTVQTHIKNLYGKLSVHSKSEAVFEATRMGLLPRHA